MNPDKFTIQIDAESIQDLGQVVSLRANVYGADGKEFFFVHPVTLRSKFYQDLKAGATFSQDLKRICKARCREEMLRRIQANAVTAEDAMNLMTDKPE